MPPFSLMEGLCWGSGVHVAAERAFEASLGALPGSSSCRPKVGLLRRFSGTARAWLHTPARRAHCRPQRWGVSRAATPRRRDRSLGQGTLNGQHQGQDAGDAKLENRGVGGKQGPFWKRRAAGQTDARCRSSRNLSRRAAPWTSCEQPMLFGQTPRGPTMRERADRVNGPSAPCGWRRRHPAGARGRQ